MLDVLLRGAMVADGSGAEAFPADVAISNGRIVEVGPLQDAKADVWLDCSGRYVLPGFIDAHSHADAAVFSPDGQLALLRQGVTTVVAGQDGVSFAPGDGRYAAEYFAALNGPRPDYAGPAVADLLAAYDGTTPVNVAYLVPHGTLRHQAMGVARRPPTARELEAMIRAVAQGLEQGALGLSSGLDYVPGKFADDAEFAALCRPVAAAGALYVTHMRGGYEANSGAGVAEVESIAAGSGVACHISHYHGPATLLIKLVDDARITGTDLTFDTYPYRRGCSLLAMVALPDRLHDLGVAEATRLLLDPATRAELVRDWLPGIGDLRGIGADWAERITLTHVAAPEYAWAAGKSVHGAALHAGITSAEFIADVLAASRLAVGAVFEFPLVSTDDDVRALLRHEAHVAGSDGIYVGTHPHPRAWGTFARLIGRHTRDDGDYTWGAAAHHLAGHTASRFGLANRGLVRRGYAADLAIVDPARVADRATYDQPRQLAEGIDDVLVNGEIVLRQGRLTGVLSGHGLRRGE